LLEIIGRICELKSTGSLGARCLASPAIAGATDNAAKIVKVLSRAKFGIRHIMQSFKTCFGYELFYTESPWRSQDRSTADSRGAGVFSFAKARRWSSCFSMPCGPKQPEG